jgi:hypothetical protein
MREQSFYLRYGIDGRPRKGACGKPPAPHSMWPPMQFWDTPVPDERMAHPMASIPVGTVIGQVLCDGCGRPTSIRHLVPGPQRCWRCHRPISHPAAQDK